MNLDNKVVFITGSSRGIGNAIAREFILKGAKVVICGSKYDNAVNAVDKIKSDLNVGDDVLMPVGFSMTDKNEIKKAVDEVVSKWGHIDVLINNAGITSNKSFLDLTSDDFRKMFDVNFFGTVDVTREVVMHMMKTGGSIINTSSMVGIYGAVNQSDYATSKFAINGLTKSLAKELGKYQIRVNAVAPGVVDTDMMRDFVSDEMKQHLVAMTPLRKMANVDDLVGAYLYLASDLSKFTTGTIIQVDGGLLL
jgi:3-oxoacyl-[acyl-carrier protein] reductase/7-alpha-hydroxysteroid dehydrogenase